MQIGILGGSFNPPHLAHVLAAVLYLKANKSARVWVVPCFKHPFQKNTLPFQQRLEMCRLAFATLGSSIAVKDIERRLGGTSYTSKTLRALKQRYPKYEFELILGSDSAGQLKHWKNANWIKKNIPLFVIPRGLKNPTKFSLPAVSSSQIRRRLANRKSVERLVPQTVMEFIAQRNLYAGKR